MLFDISRPFRALVCFISYLVLLVTIFYFLYKNMNGDVD